MRAAGGSLQPEGPVAASMADLWWLMLLLGTAVFVLFLALLGRGLLRSDDDTSDEKHPRRSGAWLVGGGVLLPLVVIGVVFAATLQTMRATPVAEADDLVVELVGHQWWWEVRYPAQEVITANEIHIPVGRQVTFKVTSADVIHSFWVPALGGKIDLLPEDENTMVLQADEPGRHRSQCAEFCGLQHAKMAMIVVAEPLADFQSWLSAQAPTADPPATAAAQRGRDVFLGSDCVRCHTIDGTTTAAEEEAPNLTHLTSRLTLGAGVLENTPENLRAWVADPHTFKPGVKMPPHRDMSSDQLDALVAYLDGLE